MDAASHDAKSESCVYARVSVCIYHYDFIGLRMSSFFSVSRAALTWASLSPKPEAVKLKLYTRKP